MDQCCSIHDDGTTLGGLFAFLANPLLRLLCVINTMLLPLTTRIGIPLTIILVIALQLYLLDLLLAYKIRAKEKRSRQRGTKATKSQ